MNHYYALTQDSADGELNVIYLGYLTPERAEMQRDLLTSTGEHSDVLVATKEQLNTLYGNIHTELTTPK
jgi:hypothetical protein